MNPLKLLVNLFKQTINKLIMEVKLDQHFLNSKNILKMEQRIAAIKEDDIIFEIGPGDGRLSHFLLEGKPKKLISVEMDKNLEEDLKKLKSKYKNFEYIIGNGLDEFENHKFNKLVANIPYSITEPLYIKILEKKIPYIILLHGTTFFDKLHDETNKWHYFVNAFYDVENILDIAGNAFIPPAKTMSNLIKLELKTESKLTENEKKIQILFSKYHRNLKNAVIFTLVDLDKTKKESREIFEKLEFKKELHKKNLGSISNEDFVEILEKLEFK